jgi:hypothetical protein
MCCGFHVTHAPHTCSVSQPLPSHVSRSRNRHQKVAEIDVCTPRHVMSLLLSCQFVPNYLNHCPVWDFTLHTHPTHILSANNCHHMCLDQGIWTGKTLKLTFIHQDSRLDIFYSVNLCQTSSIILVSGIPLYTGTPHVSSLPTTVIACVWVKE